MHYAHILRLIELTQEQRIPKEQYRRSHVVDDIDRFV